MSNNRAAKLWGVNVTAFVFIIILTVTGLVNWLLLPRGWRGGDVMASLRHVLLVVHQWTALLFIVSMVVHWALHWSYIQSNLKRHGYMR